MNIGDVVLLKTCPDDPTCYFFGKVVRIDGSIGGYSLFPMMTIEKTNCKKDHTTNKHERAVHNEDFENGKAILWI